MSLRRSGGTFPVQASNCLKNVSAAAAVVSLLRHPTGAWVEVMGIMMDLGLYSRLHN
jgi:hypothetical protein